MLRTAPAALLLLPLTLAGMPGSAAAKVTAERPGPSLQLFSNPYYACTKNYYVAANGSDSNSGASPNAPFATLQHANDVLPTGGAAAGTCINVAPGTYTRGVTINRGGNAASSTGYVVYRCTTMDACIVTDSSAGFNWDTSAQPMPGNYVMVDGFDLAAAAPTTYGQGIKLWSGQNTFTRSVHHVWVLNSLVHGYGQSGLNMNNGEYFYAVHNRIYANAAKTCDAQGSGLTYVTLIQFPNYTPTADDLNNSILGNIGSGFHNAVEWNIVYNNAITQCGSQQNPYDTDGNNIILDTLNWTNISGGTPYTAGVLVAFNVVFNGGGGGIHVFLSNNVTVANNSCFNGYLDPYNNASARGCIDTNGSYNNTIINNIAVAVPAQPNGKCNWNTAPYAMFNSAVLGGVPSGMPPSTFAHNISLEVGTGCWANGGNDPTGEAPMFNGDTYSCSNNKCATDPAWTRVGNKTKGNETQLPAGRNFALLPTSPAIGYGLTKSYLSPQAIDAGACFHTFDHCW